MLDALKFVQGAVATKDFNPELTHFSIKDGFVRGYNGVLSLCSPIELDINATPKAIPFVKAIETCKDMVALSKTPTGRLSIKSGRFKSFVECIEDESFPMLEPEGEVIPLEKELTPALKKLVPFIGQDASRPWATGILFTQQSAFATNNILIVEQWLGYPFPVEINIPASTVKELLRIKKEPKKLQITDTSITFHFERGQWLRSQLYNTEWPDLGAVLNHEHNAVPFPEGFFEALEDIGPFVDKETNRVYLENGFIATSLDKDTGTIIEVKDLKGSSCFQHKQLLYLKDLVNKIDLSLYPQPCLFYGDKFRGAIAGMRI